MRFVAVDKLPNCDRGRVPRAEKHQTQKDLDAFMKMGIKIARVDILDGEFANVRSIESSLNSAVRIGAFPIKVVRRQSRLYLVRKDI